MVINAVQFTVFLKLTFKSYRYQYTNVVYIFLEGSNLNIAFQFVILILQSYIQRNYITVFGIFSRY